MADREVTVRLLQGVFRAAVGAVNLAELVVGGANAWVIAASPRAPRVTLTCAELPAAWRPPGFQLQPPHFAALAGDVKSKLSSISRRKANGYGGYIPAPPDFINPVLTLLWFDPAALKPDQAAVAARERPHFNARASLPFDASLLFLQTEKNTARAQLVLECVEGAAPFRAVWKGVSVPDWLVLDRLADADLLCGSFDELLLAIQLAIIYEHSPECGRSKVPADFWGNAFQLLLAGIVVELAREARRQALTIEGLPISAALRAGTLVAFVPKDWLKLPVRADAAQCRLYRFRWSDQHGIEVQRSDLLTVAELLELILELLQ